MVAIGRFGSLFFSLGTVPAIARALGPEGRGTSAALLAVVAIGTVALGLGVPLAVRRLVSAGEHRPNVMTTGRLYAFLMTIPAVALSVPVYFLMFSGLTQGEAVAFFISMACIPLSISWAMDVSVLVSTREYRRIAVLGLIQAGSYFSIIVAGWLTDSLTIASVLYAQLAGNLLSFLVGLFWVSARGGKVVGFALLVREGASLAGGQLADIASRRLDQVIVLPLLGAGGAGLYSVAVTVGSLPVPVAQAVGVAAFNGLAQAEDDDRFEIKRVLRYSSLLGLFSAVPLAVASYFLIPIVFGSEFSDAVPVAMVAIIGSIFGVVGFNCSMALAAKKRGRELTTVQLVGLGFSVLLIFPLSLWFGPVGTAVSTALGTFLTMSLTMWRLGVRPRDAVPLLSDVSGVITMMTRSGRI